MLTVSRLLWLAWAWASPWLGPLVERALPGAARARAVAAKARPALISAGIAAVALGALTIGLRTALTHARDAGATAATATGDAGWRTRLATERANWHIQQRARDLATQRRVDQARLAWEATLGDRADRIRDLEIALAAIPAGGVAYTPDVARALNRAAAARRPGLVARADKDLVARGDTPAGSRPARADGWGLK
jgi:hypothetical protein